ncbi:hypothetical protein [Streptomyces murinus]|uniref:hypothetical protein n=1 Tax=Streptomyces murinus TaxID=33900 RepID=UPI001F2D17EA|nr:hypothetical protein [Streptomyces murinus]
MRTSVPSTVAAGPGVFITDGDRVHISSTPPRTASAHAWWTHVSGPGTKPRLIGVPDSPEKAYTKPVTVKCGV